MRAIRLPKTKHPPKRLEKQLFRIYWPSFKSWLDDLIESALAQKKQLDALRIDDAEEYESRVDGLFDETFEPFKDKWNAQVSQYAQAFYKFGMRVNTHARMGFQAQIDTAAAVKPDVQRTIPGLTPAIHSEIEDFVAENVRLVKQIGNEGADRLQRLVLQAHKDGLSTEKLAKQIQKDLKYNENRCKLIAADQLGKANSDLTRVNHQEADIKGYFWTTSKVNVRPLHEAREGQYFSYDDPPSDGHAGKPIRCRCTETPDIFGTGPAQSKAKPKQVKPIAVPSPVGSGGGGGSGATPPSGPAAPPPPPPRGRGPALPPVQPPGGGSGGGQPPGPPDDFNLDRERAKVRALRNQCFSAVFTPDRPLENFDLGAFEKGLDNLFDLNVPGYTGLKSTILKKANKLVEAGNLSVEKNFSAALGDMRGQFLELEIGFIVNSFADLKAMGLKNTGQDGDIDILAVYQGQLLMVECKDYAKYSQAKAYSITIPNYLGIIGAKGGQVLSEDELALPKRLDIVSIQKLKLKEMDKEFFESNASDLLGGEVKLFNTPDDFLRDK